MIFDSSNAGCVRMGLLHIAFTETLAIRVPGAAGGKLIRLAAGENRGLIYVVRNKCVKFAGFLLPAVTLTAHQRF
jgi:hypothetical protein